MKYKQVFRIHGACFAMLLAHLFVFLFLSSISAATYSIAFFKSQDETINFNVQVNAFTTSIIDAISGQYYNFDYNIGSSLGVSVTLDASKTGYYLIKKGPDGVGETLQDSRATTFYVENKCPNTQSTCKLDISTLNYVFTGALASIYVNNVLYSEYSVGIMTIFVKPVDVIKIVVTGTPTDALPYLAFAFYNISVSVYGRVHWYYNNYVTDAVIETVGFTSPQDGSMCYVSTSGRSIGIKLSSTPLAELYNVQAICGSYPPITKMIESNSATAQTLTIPSDYTSQSCLLSVIDTMSDLNMVKIVLALTAQEISQCARNFVLRNVIKFHNSNE